MTDQLQKQKAAIGLCGQ